MVFDLFFYCVTVKTIYRDENKHRRLRGWSRTTDEHCVTYVQPSRLRNFAFIQDLARLLVKSHLDSKLCLHLSMVKKLGLALHLIFQALSIYDILFFNHPFFFNHFYSFSSHVTWILYSMEIQSVVFTPS